MLRDAFFDCEGALKDDFFAEQLSFRKENEFKIEQALLLLEQRARRKLSALNERLLNQRRSEDERRRRVASATEGLIRKEQADFEQRKARIKASREASVTSRAIAGGFILIEDRGGHASGL